MAEKWIDLTIPVKKLLQAREGIPAPPVPDDNWAMKMNELHRAVEGLSEYLTTRKQMEEMAEG